jgi:SET domain-containing protein
MMYVKTKVSPSPIDGLGLFADQFIPKGTLLWRFTPGFDLKFSQEQIDSLPIQLQVYLKKYAYLSKKSHLYVLAVDDAKYFNHSFTPNSNSLHLEGEEEVVEYALIDINIGDEITDNYYLFDDSLTSLDSTELF